MARFRNSRGGGVLMYVRNDITFEMIENLTGICDSHESLFIRFNLRGFGKVILGGIYRAPNGSIADFNNFLVNALNDIRRLNSGCILMRDFNINYFRYLNIDSAEYFNILCKNSIKNKWHEITDLFGKNRTNNFACLSVGCDEINNDIEIVETFNNYFSNVAVKTTGLVGEPMNDYSNLLQNVQDSLYIFPSTPEEVEKIISNLWSNNA
ncbi:hypothetical protein Anas_12103 [Armadillidium nasatum]|uniref:Uncharacterized protein n=1 Tax=Armadillidium nasatum TaxID=96803 RepID=A0A5N5T0Y9_9CRUS|nr:hypothetical protein Anas_12103 [Armadillidium nasatum]